jgi:hypothetical protein
MGGAFIAVFFMSCFILGSESDRQMESYYNIGNGNGENDVPIND